MVGRALGESFQCDLETWSDSSSLAGKIGGYDCVLLDLRALPNGAEDEAGLKQIERFQHADFSPPIIVMLGDDNFALSRRFIGVGIYEVLPSPPRYRRSSPGAARRAHRLHQVELELRQLRVQRETSDRLDDLIGISDNMLEVFGLARKVAPCDVQRADYGRDRDRQEHVGACSAPPQSAQFGAHDFVLLRQFARASSGR